MSHLIDLVGQVDYAVNTINKNVIVITVESEQDVEYLYEHYSNFLKIDPPRRIGIKLPKFLKMFQSSFLQLTFIYKQKVVIIQNK